MRRIQVALTFILALSLPQAALAQETPSETAGEAAWETSSLNFNESFGCGDGVAGPRTPSVGYSGYMNWSTRIRGPWGDFFGRDYAQISGSLVTWPVPMSGGATRRVHERALPAYQNAAANIAAAGSSYPITTIYSFAYRTVGGSTRISTHSVGTAIDINPQQNPYSENLITNMPAWFQQAFIDAGFCWGGQWEDVKDTMHFSWLGPLSTPGYGARPAPYPPLTAAANYGSPVLNAALPAFSGAATGWSLSDRTRDGAADLFSVRSTPSGARIEMVGAVGEFSTVGLRQDVPVGSYDDLHITDIDSDGWPELMAVTTGPSSSVINIWTEDESVWSLDRIINTSATGDLFFGFYDNDFEADLIEVIRGATTTIKVRSGASGFNDITATAAVALDSTGGELAIGDRNVDGVVDVFHGDAFGIRVVDIAASTVTSAGSLVVPAGTTMLLADYDGDGREDVHLVSGKSLSIHLGGVPPAGEDPDGWFDNGDSIVWDAGPDCVGPEACDSIGFVGPGGQWSLKEAPATVTTQADFFYGNPGDVAFSGDWNCDGIDTPGAYRRSDGYVYLRNANTEGVADAEYFFGNPGDLPLIGDFDNDGCDSVSIYRPSEQRFYIINGLGDGQGGLGAAEYSFIFGNPGDKPFTGDFDGDGTDEVGLHRESSGFIYYRFTLTEGSADAQYFFGDPGDIMRTGDWNGDGTDTLAVYRPSDGNWYLKMANAAGRAEYTIHFHEEDETIQPVVGVFGQLDG